MAMDALRAERVTRVVVGDDGALGQRPPRGREAPHRGGRPSHRVPGARRRPPGRRTRPCGRRTRPRSRRRGRRRRTLLRSFARASGPSRGVRCARRARRNTSDRPGPRHASRCAPGRGSSRRSRAGTRGPGRSRTGARPFRAISPSGSVRRGSRPHERPPRGINDRMRRGRNGRAKGANAPASRVSLLDGRTTSRPSHRRNRARRDRLRLDLCPRRLHHPAERHV